MPYIQAFTVHGTLEEKGENWTVEFRMDGKSY
jgi:hypothetical protein